MRRFATAGFLALLVALFTGCSDQNKESPVEPQYKKVSNGCTGLVLDELDDIHEEINLVFNGRQAKRGAHQIVDNIGRKVCAEPPTYDATPAMAEGFYQHVLNEPVEEFVGGLSAAIALVERVFAFALGTPQAPIPPEAFEPDGGVGVVTPGVQDTIWTNNDEAAFVALPGSFGGDQPVTVVLERLADPVFPNTGSPIFGFQAFPEAYDFSANAVLDGTAEFWMCVLLDDLPVPFENLAIGHDLGDGASELLEPPLYEDFPGQIIDCSAADYQFVPPVVASARTPGWLQLAGTILQPIANAILDVKPLNAMYFAGRGLGGRGGSLSPFAPVDRGVSSIPDPVIAFVQSTINEESPPDSENYINRYEFTTTNWSDFPAYLFESTGEPACESRTWLDIYDAIDDTYIYGFCAFDSPADLQYFWFSTQAGQGPPDIYAELWDRESDIRYRSNTVAIPPVFNTLTVAGVGTGSGTITRPDYITCLYSGGVTTGDCTASTEEWVHFGGIVAIPDAGSSFSGWSGACTGMGSCLVEMDADKTAVATFTAD